MCIRDRSEGSSVGGGVAGGGGVWKFGVQKMEKIKILKIQIRSAQNVGKVWISRKKILPALFGAISGHFFHGPKKCQNCAYFPGVGPLLLSTRGGGIGTCHLKLNRGTAIHNPNSTCLLGGALAAIHPGWGNRYLLWIFRSFSKHRHQGG